MSRIEQVIEEIEAYIDSCKYQTLSNSKIIVNRDELDELINDLKHCIPEEVKKYQRMIAKRDAILKDAQDKAEEMIKKANEMTVKLVSEHEIMQKAYAEANDVVAEADNRAQEIIQHAQAESNEIRTATVQYTDDSLAMIQGILTNSMESFQARYNSLMEALQSNLYVTNSNRKQLHPNSDRSYSAEPENVDFTPDREPERTAYEEAADEAVSADVTDFLDDDEV